MDSRNKIDYSKFRCDVYSPDGIFISNAAFNAKHEFYCPELVPGQKYFLVFTYDNIFVDCFSYTCNNAGKVVYLTNGHLFYNRNAEEIPEPLINIIRPQLEKAYLYYKRWRSRPRKALDAFIESTHEKSSKKSHRHKNALDAFIDSTHEGAHKMSCTRYIQAYCVGSDLSAPSK